MQSPYPVGWVAPSDPVRGCPPGLENLIPLDYLLVQQQMEVLELISNYETENKYYVKNRWGQILFFAQEQSGCCARNCFPMCRPFQMDISDLSQRIVIHLDQPSAICCKRITVEAPLGQLLGSVQQNFNLSKPSLNVLDPAGQTVFLIQGPAGYVLCGCCKRNVPFKLLALDGVTEVGSIWKVWSGFGQERITDADNFAVNFPVDLDVRLKAVLLGACVLIDMIYFESES